MEDKEAPTSEQEDLDQYSPRTIPIIAPENSRLAARPWQTWQPNEVANWLTLQDLGRYAHVFISNNIDGITLSTLTRIDLAQLEIGNIKIYKRFSLYHNPKGMADVLFKEQQEDMVETPSKKQLKEKMVQIVQEHSDTDVFMTRAFKYWCDDTRRKHQNYWRQMNYVRHRGYDLCQYGRQTKEELVEFVGNISNVLPLEILTEFVRKFDRWVVYYRM